MLSLEEALEKILSQVVPLDAEQIELKHAAGRFLAIDHVAKSDLPRSDNSAMDGFALRSEDVKGPSPSNPVQLLCIDTVPAGKFSAKRVEKGTCIRLFTGSPMPTGADAVIMQEDTRREGDSAVIQILDEVKPWENVRFKGEDIRAGSMAGKKGSRLTAGRIGLLAAAALEQALVAKAPRVSIVPTGNELIRPGEEPTPASVYESNQVTIAALCREIGVEPLLGPIGRDTLAETTKTLQDAFETSDAVITCGGASVGDYDFVKQAFEAMGGTLDFWKVAIRPGKPFIFGKLGKKLLFGLPGNPVSAFVTFYLLVRPALLKMQGASELTPKTSDGTLGENVVNRGDRRHFMRVQRRRDGTYVLSGGQGSHYMSSLAEAEALIDVPPNSTLPIGSSVKIILL